MLCRYTKNGAHDWPPLRANNELLESGHFQFMQACSATLQNICLFLHQTPIAPLQRGRAGRDREGCRHVGRGEMSATLTRVPWRRFAGLRFSRSADRCHGPCGHRCSCSRRLSEQSDSATTPVHTVIADHRAASGPTST